jgi:hypothetical protein
MLSQILSQRLRPDLALGDCPGVHSSRAGQRTVGQHVDAVRKIVKNIWQRNNANKIQPQESKNKTSQSVFFGEPVAACYSKNLLLFAHGLRV